MVEDGKIIGIDRGGNSPKVKKVIDVAGKYFLPGIIDVHVHFRELGFTYKEDFETGMMAVGKASVTRSTFHYP